MQGIENYNLIPYKCWIILREDLKYSYERMLSIGIKNIVLPFYSEANKDIRAEWVEQGAKFEAFMSFNMAFVEEIEDKLIEHGHIYKWIYDGDTPVGILVEPTRHQFKNDILQYNISLKDYSRCRLAQFDENIVEKEEI